MGDARNNMGNSLMVGCAKMGIDFRAAAPTACQPAAELVRTCREIADATGAKITITDDIALAVKDADFSIYRCMGFHGRTCFSMGRKDKTASSPIR